MISPMLLLLASAACRNSCVLDEASRRFVTGSSRPRRIAAIHLPPADTVEVEAALHSAGVTVGLPQAPGSRLLASAQRRKKPDA